MISYASSPSVLTATNNDDTTTRIGQQHPLESEDPIIVDYVSDIEDNDDISTPSSSNTTTNNNTNNNNHTEQSQQHSSSSPPLIKPSTTTTSNPNNTTSTTESEDPHSNNMWSCNICFDTASEPVITQCGHLYCWSCIYRWMQSHSTQNLTCPVCKAGIHQDKLIPIYGRGCSSNSSSNNGNDSTNNNDSIPNRPRGQYTDSRTTPNPNYNPFHNISSSLFGNFGGGGGGSGLGGGVSFGGGGHGMMGGGGLGGGGGSNQFLFSDAFRFFPFFDLANSFNATTTTTSGIGGNGTRNGSSLLLPPPTEQEELQGFVRRLALFLGFILLFYIIFV